MTQLTKNLYTCTNWWYRVWEFFSMSSYFNSVLKENVIPPSKVGSSINILSQTLGEQSPYSTLGLRPRVEYGNSSPRVWERITILLPPSEGGMYHTFFFTAWDLNLTSSSLISFAMSFWWSSISSFIFIISSIRESSFGQLAHIFS